MNSIPLTKIPLTKIPVERLKKNCNCKERNDRKKEATKWEMTMRAIQIRPTTQKTDGSRAVGFLSAFLKLNGSDDE